MKVCSKCEQELTVDSFHKDKSREDGLQSCCKKCVKQYQQSNAEKRKQYRIDNKDRTNKYYQDNKVAIAERHKLYRQDHKEILTKQRKQYKQDNKDVIAQQRKQYRQDNKETIAKYNKQHRSKNLETIKEHNRRYDREHLEERRIGKQKYRARKNMLINTLTIEQWENIKLYFNNECAYCGKALPLAQEHLIPVSKGGEYTHNNIVPSCKACNCSKNNRDFFLWYPKQCTYSKKREKTILTFLNYKNKAQQLQLIVV